MKYVFDGKKLYKVFCQNCHGIKGKGDGFLYKSGKLPVKPGDLSQERLVQASRGELFHVISIGFGLMKPHASQLTESDRWKIVEYVKVKLQGQKIGERTLASASSALSEPYADFEARIAKTYPQTIGVGPVQSIQFGSINQVMVEDGKELFKVKCSSCHKPLKKYIGPAPKGIMDRRSPEWIMNMILDPEGMVENDPVAKELLKRYLSPMANQSLTEDETRKILEYFRTLE
jgi:mono/diheme cytochrome c family protein